MSVRASDSEVSASDTNAVVKSLTMPLIKFSLLKMYAPTQERQLMMGGERRKEKGGARGEEEGRRREEGGGKKARGSREW